MTAVPLADAARLLGKPERTIRRWAASGKLPATKTADGWLVEIAIDANGQLAATDRTNGHASGHMAEDSAATGGQLAAVPVSYLHDLQVKAEAAAFWQGRASVLEERVLQLEQAQLALAAPKESTSQERPFLRDSERLPNAPTQTPAETRKGRPWWRFWAQARNVAG